MPDSKPRNSKVSIAVGLGLVALFGFIIFLEANDKSAPGRPVFTDAQYQAAIDCPTDDEERRQAALEARSDPKDDSRVMTCEQMADFVAEEVEVETPTLLDSDYLAADILASNERWGITSVTCIEASAVRQFQCNAQYYSGISADLSILVSVDGQSWVQLN